MSVAVVPEPNETKLNEGVSCELYVMKKVKETLGSISNKTTFSKLDANSGFHQVVLTDKTAKLVYYPIWAVHV